MKTLLVILLGVWMTGCTGGGVVAKERPAGMSRKEYNTQLKADGVSFWSRNDDLPFSLVFLFFEGMREFDGTRKERK